MGGWAKRSAGSDPSVQPIVASREKLPPSLERRGRVGDIAPGRHDPRCTPKAKDHRMRGPCAECRAPLSFCVFIAHKNIPTEQNCQAPLCSVGVDVLLLSNIMLSPRTPQYTPVAQISSAIVQMAPPDLGGSCRFRIFGFSAFVRNVKRDAQTLSDRKGQTSALPACPLISFQLRLE
jgi:hypothetical protein